MGCPTGVRRRGRGCSCRRGLGGLVQDDEARERGLVGGVGCVELGQAMDAVDHRHHGVQAALRGEHLIGLEGLDHRRRIGEAGGLDQDRVERPAAVEQAAQGADQVAAHDAADAAGGKLDQLLLAGLDQRAVDPGIAELVDDDGDAPRVAGGEQAVEQGGLPGAQRAGQDGDGDAIVLHRGHAQAQGISETWITSPLAPTALIASWVSCRPKRCVVIRSSGKRSELSCFSASSQDS